MCEPDRGRDRIAKSFIYYYKLRLGASTRTNPEPRKPQEEVYMTTVKLT